MSTRIKLVIFSITLLGLVALTLGAPTPLDVKAQQPTGSVPTVTSTLIGPSVTVYADIPVIEVYAGPSTYLYPPVGVLLAGQSAPALGRAQDADWIQIYYPGIPGNKAWIYAIYVRLSPGARLPVLAAPPTPTPFSTPTIDPTLSAAFIGPQTPTRLPTFTPPAPLSIPTFSEEQEDVNRVPVGLIIFSLGFIGALGAMISFLRGR